MAPRPEVRYLWYPCGSLGGFVVIIFSFSSALISSIIDIKKLWGPLEIEGTTRVVNGPNSSGPNSKILA